MTKINVEITSKFHQNFPVANELKKNAATQRTLEYAHGWQFIVLS